MHQASAGDPALSRSAGADAAEFRLLGYWLAAFYLCQLQQWWSSIGRAWLPWPMLVRNHTNRPSLQWSLGKTGQRPHTVKPQYFQFQKLDDEAPSFPEESQKIFCPDQLRRLQLVASFWRKAQQCPTAWLSLGGERRYFIFALLFFLCSTL